MSDNLIAYYIAWGEQGVKNQYVGVKDDGPSEGELVISTDTPVKWYASPKAFDGGPARLGVGQYKYTYVDPAGQVWASNDKNKSQDFYYITNSGGFFISTDDGDMEHVWTINPGAGITIQPYNPGDDRQWFNPDNA